MTSYVMKELPPAGNRLLGPHPEGAGNADDHRHEVFDHEDLEVGSTAKVTGALAEGARQRVERLRARSRAHLHVPRKHPLVEIRLLVEEAGDHDQSRYDVQHGKDADANHEFLELVGLRSVVLHHRPDAKERDEARQQEHRAQ